MEIRDSVIEELQSFVKFESDTNTAKFISPYTLEKHKEEFNKHDIIYKTILYNKKHVGFLLLKLDDDNESIEFRRIVINQKGKDFGQKTIQALDTICKDEFCRNRIWLDVLGHNQRAIHIYEKCGYRFVKTGDYRGMELRIYEKMV